MRGKLFAAALVSVACLGAARGARAQVVISIEGGCPGQVRVSWEGATPDRWMALLYADMTGGYVLPHWCDGTRTGLSTRGLRLVAVLRSGAQGRGARAGQARTEFCGGSLQMIVKDGYPCTTSNVVQIPQ